MKKSRFTEQQIAYALKQAELGMAVGEICRKMGVAEATFYVWRKKYGGLSELQRPVAAGVFERALVLVTGRRAEQNRSVAALL
ncbi:hypothetical protein FFY77_02435 [Xanthomonas translucens pv. translucens]|uniref:Transposase n=1 Tax=Xanthomonas translucens pv. translucens DSM 18974 TaxID=1261556 RepID=A0A1C3TK18_XANCT|nr:transposase [Xanthomonas translucens]MQS40592.1 hypothetical protein [Xanthomonas translucens pv. translucens]CCP40432.1 Low calcium response locus protein S [Xanthomonas translucens pv. translucens DSM 18974]SCB03587.1 unnamed protein product [Xanthomonas translucens pv. translucens DSM 18974]